MEIVSQISGQLNIYTPHSRLSEPPSQLCGRLGTINILRPLVKVPL
jgi:hypothetical protein